MKCKEFLAKLGDYVDGDLQRETYEAFKSHLSGCNKCEVVIDNLRHTITVYKCGHTVELPAELQQQLRRILRDHWDAHFPSTQGH